MVAQVHNIFIAEKHGAVTIGVAPGKMLDLNIITIEMQNKRITISDDRLVVSDNPILGFVEGDGIGPDITSAAMKVWNAAVDKAYGGKRKVHWAELYLGEKAAGIYDGDYFPAETLDAIRELVVAIKGPLTTPIGGGFR